jgi:NMD protein affecting ribosome stability and mRNA decay
MSVFKKSCFECGKKVDVVKESLCLDCYKEQNPPIKEMKPMNMKYCNICGRIHYNNYFYPVEEFEEVLPNLLKKRIEFSDGYKLNSIKVDDFEVRGSKIGFDVEVDVDFTE